METKKFKAMACGILSGVVAIALLPLRLLIYVLKMKRHLRRVSQPGRDASAQVSSTDTPLTTFLRTGRHGDPINIQFLATAGQLAAAFVAAGWYRADEIDLVTSVRISFDSLLDRKYSTAPVSNLYLYGRKEDMAFERPGHSVRERDHIRVWNTGRSGADERPLWIGSATKDSKVELSHTNHLPTHCIAPDLDAERALVVSELAQTGFVVGETTRPGFGQETHGFNGGGDPYFTDGQVVVLSLANVPTLPIATQVRTPQLARITRKFAHILHPALPLAGRKRAEREQERIKQQAQAH
jgi:hypothetical protein